MGCLANALYDPASAVTTKTTAAAAAMVAFDTTNLRLTFTVPSNGMVHVRIAGTVHGATTFPQILLGVLQSTTVIARQSPAGGIKTTATATAQVMQEASFVITGLTPGASLTWDAAYGIVTAVAATAIKYGGGNDTTTDNAFGAFIFEIWDAYNCLGAVCYDPASVQTKVTTSRLAMTAFDTTNARIVFTVPPSGKVLVRVGVALHSNQVTYPVVLLGVLQSSTVIARVQPIGALKSTAVATAITFMEATFVKSGLTPGSSLTWDAAYGIEILIASSNGLRYGGPDDASGAMYGALVFEIWAA